MKKKNSSRIDLDWYLIPISSLKKIGIIIVSISIVLIASYLFYLHYQSPKTKAQRYLKEADKKVEEIAQLPNFPFFRTKYQDLKEKLQKAQKFFLEKNYPETMEIASSVLEDALKTLGSIKENSPGSVEEIIDLEGKVQIQRKDQGIWEDAKPRMGLYPGDFVKTFSNGSVRIMTKNNSVIVLPPNSLHEVAEPIITKSGEAIEKITMKAGSVDITTQNQKAQVVTLQANAELEKYTSASFISDSNKEEIQTIRGSAKVLSGDKTYEVTALEKLKLEKGKEAEKIKILPSPKHIEPVINKAFLYNPNLKITLSWEKLEEAVAYIIQVSQSAFFIEPNEKKITKNSIPIMGFEPGDYYWRVKAIDNKGDESPWSMATKFRVLTTEEMERLDKIPPQLNVKADTPLGNQCIITGQTEPGCTVIIEGETITPDSDGSFTTTVSLKYVGENIVSVQAVDPAGNETTKKLRIFVRE